MADNRKYYNLKLKEDFFDTDEMKILESMKDGYLYSNILLKLYLKSLCYEDVRVPGDWCHRTVFAEWWAEQTGELIEELYDPSEPKVKKPAAKKESKDPVKKAVEARKEEPGYEQLSLFGLAGI